MSLFLNLLVGENEIQTESLPNFCGCRLQYHGVSRLAEKNFIYIAPAPVFSWFKRLNNGMLGLMEVLGGMFILGGITAPDVAALEAKPKMNPGVPHFQTFLAAVTTGSYAMDCF